MTRNRLPQHAATILAAGALAFGAWALSVGWTNSILGMHAFRQTQTALTAVGIQRGGPILAYETPIMGPPWRIPFEAPLYQWIVASASQWGAPLELTGRATAVAFFVLCLVLAWRALSLLDVSRQHRLPLVALLAISPIYVYWSRTFMIESTALCLALAYLCLVDLATRREGGRAGAWSIAASAAGIGAALVKTTTVAPFLAASVVLVLWRWQAPPRRPAKVIGTIAVLVVAPLLAATLWLRFTESVKAEGPLSARIVASTPYMRQHNFGTLDERLQPRTWIALGGLLVGGRTKHSVVGSLGVFAAAVTAALLSRRRRAQAALCLGLGMLPVIVFTNLYVEHVYYAYANGLFFIAAMGLGLVACLERPRTAWLGVVLFLAASGAMAQNYLGGYYRDQAENPVGPQPIADAIRAVTGAGDVILLYGLDWSSEVPYLADRRAIMDWEALGIDHPAIGAAVDAVPPPGITLVAACGERRSDPAVKRTVDALAPTAVVRTVADCTLYSNAR